MITDANIKNRSTLFKHLDGIALSTVLTHIFCNDISILNPLKTKKTININFQTLKSLSMNSDYLNVSIRLFESQGWLKRRYINENKIELSKTKLGHFFINHADLYQDFSVAFDFLSHLSLIDVRHLVKLKDLIDKFKKIKTLYENNPLNNEENKLLITHLEGIILGPIIVQLSINKWIDVNTGGKIKFSRQLSQQCQNILIDCCITTNLIEKNNKLTEKGNFFFKRSTAYGVTVSYMPLFSQMNKLLYGNTNNIFDRDANGNELHVKRKMNVWGSGGAHKIYFKKIDEILIEIFNQPIEKQPKGIADMGCGDGAMLIHLYDIIKNKTKRGEILHKFPLMVVGADYNTEALKASAINLNDEKIAHILLEADISDPDSFNNCLIQKYGLHLNEFLNIRSFIDHNRIFEMPKMDYLNLKGLSTNSTAACCINDSNKILSPMIFKMSLIEHFLKWKPFAIKHGLLILELHTISTEACSKNIGNTPATAYDATHGFSNQYILEYEEYIDATKVSGLFADRKYTHQFPNDELTTVSINLFKTILNP